jgi:hypothetical protein
MSRRFLVPTLIAAGLIFLLAAAPSVAGEPEFTVQIIPRQPQVFDGQPATFFAKTEPPGFEAEVEWTTITRWGAAQPATGRGERFTTVFIDTFGGLEEECQWLAVRANEAEWKQATEPDCIPDIFIPAGEDCWQTESCDTKSSFCTDPLPADFFGGGSQLWRDEILFKGSEAITIDTIVQREGDMLFTGLDIRNVSVRLGKLDLESCENIVVDYDDGSLKEFSVELVESDFPPEDAGSMTVSRLDDLGGTFESDFPVYGKYVFTDVGDPDNVYELDTGDPDNGFDPVVMRTSGVAPWSSQILEGSEIEVCGINFFPGVLATPPPGGGGGPPVKMCCKRFGHKSGIKGHLHVTGQKCKPCPNGGCYDKKKLKCRITADAAKCDQPDEVYLGDGTDCKDSDKDGLLDWVEHGNCCLADELPQGACNALSNAFEGDTDGDGVNDGDEIKAGTDPCTPDP